MKFKPVVRCMSRGCEPDAIIKGAGFSGFAELYAEPNPTQALVERLGAKKYGNGWIARCTAAGHDDNRPSLHISEGATLIEPRSGHDDGRSAPKIHESIERAIEAAVWGLNRDGESWKHVAPVYTYHHASGDVAFKVARFENRDRDKQFRPLSPVDGGWILRGMSERRPLYRLAEIDAALVVVCEGEKAADAARTLGLNATTSANGSKSPRKTDWSPLAGRKVCILPDNDEPGRSYARSVSRILAELDTPADFRTVELPNLPSGGDLVDFVAASDSQTGDELRAAIEGLSEKAFAQPARPIDALRTEPGPNGRPRIIVNGRPHDSVSDEVRDALVASNQPPRLLVRAGQLVTVVKNEHGRPFISGINEHVLRGDVSRACHTVRINQEGEERHVTPPLEIVRDILHARSWQFPPLAGIVEGPVLRSDGTILDRPGYDPDTRTMYVKPDALTVPAIPDRPMAEDAEHAVEVLDDVLADFPFEGPSDRANALAGMLTPLVRPYIDGHCPLLILDSPQAGAGKGLIANLISMIGSGRPAALMQAPNCDDEWRKQITTALIEGATLIVIDNVEQALRSPVLASALTASEWSDRLLGANRSVCVQQRAAWIATGNNVRLGGDIPRRCYRCRIDPAVSRPWERTKWRHPDLLGFVDEHRGDLLAALLTMARAWIVAGKPPTSVKPLGSFERWTRIVGGILQYAGVADFLSNLDAMHDQADDEGPAWEAFLAEWHRLYRDAAKAVAEIVLELETENGVNDLRDALPDWLADAFAKAQGQRGQSFRVKLGKAFKRCEGKRFGDSGFHLKRVGKNRSKAVLWSVQSREG